MKVCVSLMLAAIIAAGPAFSQSLVTRGTGLAHDCFIYAKIGRDPRDGVDTCDRSLLEEALSRKDKAATYDNRGVMLDQIGHTQAAEDDFNKAIELRPDLGDAYVNLGSMLIKKRQLADALDKINKGIDLGMGFPHIGYYDRALAEELLGQYLEAYHDYQKVLELEPHYTAAEERLKDFTVTRKPAEPGPG
jgi:tetratricopeptide (TPR) repeat protein